jgi:LysR family transcriptional activator of nhaA
VVPRIVGDFDDSALVKAFGAAGAGVFPAPLALRDEVERRYDSVLIGVADGVLESYYAISNERRVSHPAVSAIVAAAGRMLAEGAPVSSKKPNKTPRQSE